MDSFDNQKWNFSRCAFKGASRVSLRDCQMKRPDSRSSLRCEFVSRVVYHARLSFELGCRERCNGERLRFAQITHERILQTLYRLDAPRCQSKIYRNSQYISLQRICFSAINEALRIEEYSMQRSAMSHFCRKYRMMKLHICFILDCTIDRLLDALVIN